MDLFRAGPIMWGRFQLACCRHRYQDTLTTTPPRGSGPPPPLMDAHRGCRLQKPGEEANFGGGLFSGRANGVGASLPCSPAAAGGTKPASDLELSGDMSMRWAIVRRFNLMIISGTELKKRVWIGGGTKHMHLLGLSAPPLPMWCLGWWIA